MTRGHKPGNDDDDIMRVLRADSQKEKEMILQMKVANKKEQSMIKESNKRTGNKPYDAEKN